MKTKGFTLIELLIVIALLGALAIGLLATIDPFEQLKKGRDTATRNTATEFYNANLRYYGTKGNFPWGTSTTIDAMSLTDVVMATTLNQLIAAGELKTNFAAAAGDNRLARIIVDSPTDDALTLCFDPESKNFALDPNTIFDSTGGATSGCVALTAANTAATACYWCIK